MNCHLHVVTPIGGMVLPDVRVQPTRDDLILPLRGHAWVRAVVRDGTPVGYCIRGEVSEARLCKR